MQEQGANPLPAQHPNRPGANPPFTVANTIFICGIDSPTLFPRRLRGQADFRQII